MPSSPAFRTPSRAALPSSRIIIVEFDARASPSSSLPRRDDLDLVAALEPRPQPLAARQHVVIQGDREMRALILEFTEQGLHAFRCDFTRLAVYNHAHCITSLSMRPCSTYASVSSASAGAI